MSDLSLQLQQANSQLPVSSYFDPALYALEMQSIFQQGPRYVGHSLSVPQVGDYYALPHENGGRALVRNAGGIELISNVCRHRQAIMLKGRGSLTHSGHQVHSGNIVCPLHRWTYSGAHAGHNGSQSGTLIGAPHFAHDPCLNLNNYKLQEWNGLLFEDNRDAQGQGGVDVAAQLAHMGPRADLSFEGYVLDKVEMHECNYNWKTFIEVYLEDYHVGPFHPGLGQFVTCDDLRWEFKDNYSVQTVGVANRLGKAGSPTYERWHKALLGYRNNVPPRHGAIWLTYYPHIMVEWYPHVLTVSTLFPMGVHKTMNMVEFFYPEEIAAFEREFVEAQQAAYMETCIEDDEIGERMDAGRRALYARGDNEVGPYQSPMEDGMQHFHEWYRTKIGAQALQF
ncbi:MAG: aromatic ring-hydroxylating dioxygenase subunit alpha [Rhodoferax sp.]|nr:aromatic ring-hydroxylating dioxygenase subunit alpha [Rhodoferax sp.]